MSNGNDNINRDLLIEKKAMAFDLIRRRDILMSEVNSLNKTISQLVSEIEAMEKSMSNQGEDLDE